MKNHQNIHASVYVRGPNRTTVLVYDENWMGPSAKIPDKDSSGLDPAWKFAGGGCEYLKLAGRWETPEETAERELYEETGLLAKELFLLVMKEKKDHIWCLYEARFDNFDGLKARGNDGEFVAKFPESTVLMMPNFLTSHKNIAKELGILSPR